MNSPLKSAAALIHKKPADPVQRLREKSESIISVFTKTVNELKSVNDEVDIEITKRQEERNRIEDQLSSLHSTKIKNENTIIKINKFFE